MMTIRKIAIFILTMVCSTTLQSLHAQVIDSIAFHLYTDSLKKGVHNYINVDGLQTDGRWIPLSGKDLLLSSTGGSFEGNNLVLDRNFPGEKVTITATYSRKPGLTIKTTIYLKIKDNNELVQLLHKKRQPGGCLSNKITFFSHLPETSPILYRLADVSVNPILNRADRCKHLPPIQRI